MAKQPRRKRPPKVTPTPAGPPQPEAFVIPTQIVIALLNYLAQRPFIEVQELIPALQNLPPHAVEVAELDASDVKNA